MPTSEYDWSAGEMRRIVGSAQEDGRSAMCRHEFGKHVHIEGSRPMLFDLEADREAGDDLDAGMVTRVCDGAADQRAFCEPFGARP